jgi:hypothetical protein
MNTFSSSSFFFSQSQYVIYVCLCTFSFHNLTFFLCKKVDHTHTHCLSLNLYTLFEEEDDDDKEHHNANEKKKKTSTSLICIYSLFYILNISCFLSFAQKGKSHLVSISVSHERISVGPLVCLSVCTCIYESPYICVSICMYVCVREREREKVDIKGINSREAKKKKSAKLRISISHSIRTHSVPCMSIIKQVERNQKKRKREKERKRTKTTLMRKHSHPRH